jgi:hypothetical protein
MRRQRPGTRRLAGRPASRFGFDPANLRDCYAMTAFISWAITGVTDPAIAHDHDSGDGAGAVIVGLRHLEGRTAMIIAVWPGLSLDPPRK